jgi:hypothetical protein
MDQFNLMEVWNATIEKSDRELKPRDYVYASELGGAMIDRYLKMKGEAYTNPPNSRSMRKFMAGDIWEWIVQSVLIKAGIEFETQEKVGVEYEGLLRVSGRIDFIILGTTNFDRVTIDETMPEFMQRLTQAIVDNFKGKSFEKCILEVKSLGSFVFEGLLAQDNPKTNHMYQAFIYRKATELPTHIVYVCRDDVRLLQYSIDSIADALEVEVKKDLTEITYYYKNDIKPEKEKLILWDAQAEKFTKNWKVEYSNYLSMLYTYNKNGDDAEETPFETPDEYYDWIAPQVAGLNRVIKRIKEGKEITKSNEEWIEKMKAYGYPLETLTLTKVAPSDEDGEVKRTKVKPLAKASEI